MKIALVTQAYYPIPGGVTELVWNLGQELQRRGHNVTVITARDRERDDRGLRVLYVGRQMPVTMNGANVHVAVAFRMGAQLRRIEHAERFDLVHIQSPIDPGLELAATRTFRAPKVGSHNSYRERHPQLELLPGYFRKVLDRIDAHIAVSRSAEGLITKYFPDIPFHIVPLGIDAQRFSPDVPPLTGMRDGTFTILYVGRMDPRKGAKFLFAALPYLEQALARYQIVVVGSGWMRRYYDALIPRALQHRVRFTGYAAPEDVPRYFRTADVYTSPATGGESFGMVLLEAMASGVPIVASDIAGYHDVVTSEREGLLVPPKNPRQLAEAIIRLAQNPLLRQQLGAAGRAKALTYAWPKIVDQIEPIYDEAIARHRRRG